MAPRRSAKAPSRSSIRRATVPLSAFCLLLLNTAEVNSQDAEHFDVQHVIRSIEYLQDPSPEKLSRVADTPAMKHLKRHSDRTGYYPLEASELDIAGEMLQGQAQHLDGVRTLLGRVRRDHRGMDLCLSEASAYLPEDFSFTGKVFFTFGYDIGVAMDRNASLNLAHPRFRKDPDEVWYYDFDTPGLVQVAQAELLEWCGQLAFDGADGRR